MTRIERNMVREANRRPARPRKLSRREKRAYDLDETAHATGEGNYERCMVEAALKSTTPDPKKEYCKRYGTPNFPS